MPGLTSRISQASRKARFIDVIAAGGTATAAAKAIGLTRRQAYRWREADAAFATEWDRATEERIDVLEQEAVRRALAGSDKLLCFLLAALDPGRFAQSARIDVTSGGQALHLTETELALRLLQIVSAAGHAPQIAPSAEPIEDVEWHAVEDVDDLV